MEIISWFKKKKFNIPLGGCIPSIPDKRDVLMSEMYPLPIRIAPVFPPPFDLTILNQGNLPHCVGYSGASLKQEKELRERISKIFNGDWLYLKCKEIDNYIGNGTYLRVLMKVLQKQGAKPEEGLEEEAIKYRIGGYARVDDLSFEGLKKAIYVNGVIIAGFTGSNAGWQSAYIRPPKLGERTWGHAVLLIGYNQDYIIGQNSWGLDWGNKGLFYVPKNYSPFESWAVLSEYPTYSDGWVASEFLRSLTFQEGAEVKPICGLNLRDAPMGNKIRVLIPSQKLKIIKIGEIVQGYKWVKVQILEES